PGHRRPARRERRPQELSPAARGARRTARPDRTEGRGGRRLPGSARAGLEPERAPLPRTQAPGTRKPGHGRLSLPGLLRKPRRARPPPEAVESAPRPPGYLRPPAMAPTTKNGSRPWATASGTAASDGSSDMSR